MNVLKTFSNGDVFLKVCLLLTIFLGSIALIHYHSVDLITAFSDGQSRLIIANNVTTSSHPGLGMLGGTWPPLYQLLLVPFAWNEFLFYSGLAGSFISLISYIIASLFSYFLVYEYTRNKKAAFIGSLVFFANPNILYLAVIPMSEMSFIATFVATTYFLLRWIRESEKWWMLNLSGLCAMTMVLIRYEGAIYIATIIPLLMGIVMWENKKSFTVAKAIAFLLSITIVPVIGLGLFSIYCLVIFGDPIFFVRSEYAPWAVAKAALEGINPEYVTRGNLFLSFTVYFRSAIDNIGWLTAILGVFGLLGILSSQRKVSDKVFALSFLFFIVFFATSLFSNTGVVILHPDYAGGANWGTRYGSSMTLAAVLYIGTLVCIFPQELGRKVFATVIALGILGNAFYSAQTGLITVQEAVSNKNGLEATLQSKTGIWFNEHFDKNDVLLSQLEPHTQFLFSSRIPRKHHINEGDRNIWVEALINPSPYANWIVMSKKNGQEDKVWKALSNTHVLEENYTLIFQEPYGPSELRIYVRNDGPVYLKKETHEEIPMLPTVQKIETSDIQIAPIQGTPVISEPVVTIEQEEQTPLPINVETPIVPVISTPVPTQRRSTIVREGQTLWIIAREQYGNSTYWSDIFQLNRFVLGNNPNILIPGTRIFLP